MGNIMMMLWLMIGALQTMGSDISNMVKNINKKLCELVYIQGKSAKDLILGKTIFNISSGENFNKEWKTFKKEIKKGLNDLNIIERVKKIIAEINSEEIKNKLILNTEKVNVNLEKQIVKGLKKLMSQMNTEECEKILENLKGDSFFNISGTPVTKELKESLKFGKKNTTRFLRSTLKKK